MFNGWALGPLHASALAFLPSLNASQKTKLQVALNAGIGAVANLPRYGHFNLSELRAQLRIPNIEQITEKTILFAAWKKKSEFNELNNSLTGPSTRSRAQGNIPQPIQKGPMGKAISTSIACGWNRLPLAIKRENDATKAKKLINNHVCNSIPF